MRWFEGKQGFEGNSLEMEAATGYKLIERCLDLN